jgi:predicted AlkP superfamily pyrophosphatase or phosphodiesterase
MTRSRHARILALILVWSLGTGPVLFAMDPPEAPPGPLVDGDVTAGAEPPGLNAGEWQAAMLGSTTAAAPRGAVQAILENPRTDMILFYKNLNESLSADEDDAYHVYARRCGERATLVEDCAPADVVFDHLTFVRTATSDGRYVYDLLDLTTEQPVGTIAAIAPVNPFGAPNGPGAVTVADPNDPRRDPSALATFADEVVAASQSVTETAPATEAGVVRSFVPPERVTYPYPYERLTAALDDADSGDIMITPRPAGETSVPGNHGALDITQSRATLIVSGRGARRTPLDPAEERTLAIKHVDIAPTVARILGVPPHPAGRHLNAGDAAANPAAPPPLLLRQDGAPLAGLLEPRVSTFVVVVDGLLPEDVTATQMPRLCNLIDCPGAVDPDPSARATVYTAARAVMVSQTNANHTAMLTGAYGATNGVVANSFYDRTLPGERALDTPSLLRVDTLFDMLRREAPHLRTAAVLGKEKLRDLYDCTNDGAGACVANDTDNPEGEAVTHVRPDFLRGAATVPAPGSDDCLAEPASGSGVALDSCVMDIVIRLSATEDPDFTFVNLGNVDSVHHVAGPNSPVAVAAITAADVQIGRLVDYLKEAGKWRDTVVIVTADHSFSWTGPLPTQRVDLETLFAADPTILGTGETFAIVGNGGSAHVYLDSLGVGSTTLSGPQATALRRMREIALAQGGVSEAWYRLENGQDPGRTLAANRPDWHLDDQRAGDLVVTALASGPEAGVSAPTAAGGNAFEVATGAGFVVESLVGAAGALQGDHGHPGARHVPFIVVGGGDYIVDQIVAPTGAVNEGDDTGANPGQPEAVDVAPTVAWIYGLEPATALPAAAGRPLTEAFTAPPIDVVEPHANRAIIFIFDGNNSVRMHDVLADCIRQPDDTFTCGAPTNVPLAAVRSLLLRDADGRLDVPQGTLTSFGSIASFPTVTFPNHNVVGSGVHPGHHGIVGNSYYERDRELERDPIDPTDPRNPLFFFSSALLRLDFETLHEAVHRAFGDWAPAPENPTCDPASTPCNGPSGAYTASVNEPSARGADFASLETVSSDDVPATFAFLAANSADFVADTDTTCANQDPTNYGQESVLDHLGQAQARALFSEASTSGLPGAPGAVPLVLDDSAGAGHPDPTYMVENFTLTDGAGHAFGPHGNCTRSGYGDTSSRLGRVLAELANHDRFATAGEPARLGETFIVLTGDHGMENQDLGGGPDNDDELDAADIEYVKQGRAFYLLTLGAELAGPYTPGTQTVTFRVFDDDRDPSGFRRGVAAASVVVENGPETQSATTDADGFVTFTLVQAVGAEVALRLDRDAAPLGGTRTVGSTSADPNSHGAVVKADFNERDVIVPLVAVPAPTPTATPTATVTATATAPTPTATPVVPACGATLAAACRTPAVPGKARLILKDKVPDSRDRLIWKWVKGGATTLADLGDPTTATGYRLCLYDGTGAQIMGAAAPAGGACRGKPCWKATKRGFRYADRDLTPDGLLKLMLKSGDAGKSKLIVKGKGEPLVLPSLPIQSLPVTVQLVREGGTCWQATFGTTLRNTTEQFRAKAD